MKDQSLPVIAPDGLTCFVVSPHAQETGEIVVAFGPTFVVMIPPATAPALPETVLEKRRPLPPPHELRRLANEVVEMIFSGEIWKRMTPRQPRTTITHFDALGRVLSQQESDDDDP